MLVAVSFPRLVQFGSFEVDLQTGELRKAGAKLKLAGQPFQVLAILLERPGEVVTAKSCRSGVGQTPSSMSITT
jgi:DNA-binding response OmpR family regulator